MWLEKKEKIRDTDTCTKYVNDYDGGGVGSWGLAFKWLKVNFVVQFRVCVCLLF